MMELMSQQALEVGAARRREVALDTMRAARASDWRIRRIGSALVAFGNWVAGGTVGVRSEMRPAGERA